MNALDLFKAAPPPADAPVLGLEFAQIQALEQALLARDDATTAQGVELMRSVHGGDPSWVPAALHYLRGRRPRRSWVGRLKTLCRLLEREGHPEHQPPDLKSAWAHLGIGGGLLGRDSAAALRRHYPICADYIDQCGLRGYEDGTIARTVLRLYERGPIKSADNPYACSAAICDLRIQSGEVETYSDDRCKCLDAATYSDKEKQRVRAGVRWLAARAGGAQ